MRGPLCAGVAAGMVLLASGCAVQRGQETMGAYIDDTGITTSFVDGTAISVETLNGTVMLSGFAKSTTERSTAERLASEVKGVKAVKNEISVRP
jgi:osmotically-inducible protein OsmY